MSVSYHFQCLPILLTKDLGRQSLPPQPKSHFIPLQLVLPSITFLHSILHTASACGTTLPWFSSNLQALPFPFFLMGFSFSNPLVSGKVPSLIHSLFHFMSFPRVMASTGRFSSSNYMLWLPDIHWWPLAWALVSNILMDSTSWRPHTHNLACPKWNSSSPSQTCISSLLWIYWWHHHNPSEKPETLYSLSLSTSKKLPNPAKFTFSVVLQSVFSPYALPLPWSGFLIFYNIVILSTIVSSASSLSCLQPELTYL